MTTTVGVLTATASAATRSWQTAEESETWAFGDDRAVRAAEAQTASGYLTNSGASVSTFGFRGNRSRGSVALADEQQAADATTASSVPARSHRTDRRPPIVPSSYRVDALKSWTGVVREVDGEFFVAELEGTAGDGAFMAEFERSQLGLDEDLTLGDVIYVTVRSVQTRFGPSKTTSVRMRRLGRWTQAELDSIQDAARTKAAELQRLLGD